jgi:Ni,Fe-hydrogenase III large subunit
MRAAAFDVAALPLLPLDDFRRHVLERVLGGSRLVTLYGRRTAETVVIDCILAGEDRSPEVARTALPAGEGYPALTPEHAAFHVFERELHEQTGLRIAGHPWLKPVRFEGRPPSAIGEYPYYVVEGKEIHEVAVGPIHAGVIEPGSFRFMCHGEQVMHLEIQLGYQHRGVEARLLAGDPRRLAPLVETIAGDSSIAHAWAHAAALEQLAGHDVDPAVQTARAVLLELERVGMHLATLSGMAADVAHLQGATTYGRLRTTAINAMMRLCGSRFGRTAVRPGGVRLRLGPEQRRELRDALALLQRDLPEMNEGFLESLTVRHRLRGVGVLTRAAATELGVVGVAARASGHLVDARYGMADGPYAVSPLPPSVRGGGDCLARAEVRIAEITASLEWLSSAVERCPEGASPLPVIGALAPERLVVSVVEGVRGEVVHCIETDAAGSLAHYKVQDPSLRNWMGLALAVRQNEISDFPICNKSFDLSYCGNDL